MKLSPGIHYWVEYHNLHSKKHHQNLLVNFFQVGASSSVVKFAPLTLEVRVCLAAHPEVAPE